MSQVAQRTRVRQLLEDHQWHNAEEIRETAGGSEGLRRMRELRHQGFVIEKRYDAEHKLWEYLMLKSHE